MKLKYIIPVAVAIGLIVFLNFGATTVKPKTKDSRNKPPIAQKASGSMPAFDFDSFLVKAKNKISPENQTKISLIKNNISRGDLTQQKIDDYEQLGNIWTKAGYLAVGAYYIGTSGKLEHSQKKLTLASHTLFKELGNKDLMPGKKRWMEKQAIIFYKSLLGINPKNDSAKMELATVYIDHQQPMQGIEQLLDIVRRDSTNIPANVMLGKLSVKSGQLDKAIARGKTILRAAPGNIDALLFMGEAYKRKGKTQKAVQLFTKAKELINDPNFTKDIDKYIASFTKPKEAS